MTIYTVNECEAGTTEREVASGYSHEELIQDLIRAINNDEVDTENKFLALGQRIQ